MGSGGARRQAQASETAARLQSQTALQVAQMQTDAATQAAEIQSQTALEAAHIAAGGTVAAAHAVGGASMYAANLVDERAREAVERQGEAGIVARQDLLEGEEAAQGYYTEAYDRARERLDPYSTLEGFAGQLEQIQDSDIFADLVENRQGAASSALGAAGLSRSGAAARAAAEIDTDTALGLNSIVYGNVLNSVNLDQAYAGQMAGTEMTTAANLASQGTATAAGQGASLIQGGTAAGNIINQGGIAAGNLMAQGAQIQAGYIQQGGLAQANAIQQGAYYTGQGLMGSANALAAGQIGAANAQAQGQQNQMSGAIAGATAGAQVGGVYGAVIGAAAGYLFYSDERMKENMRPIKKIGHLTLYSWDWKDEAKGMAGAEMSLGFSAQEVQREYPECVIERDGRKMIMYDELNKRLAA